jgi:cystathionine beta-synthase
MRAADVSQVPVVDEAGKVVGLLDESDMLVKVHHDPERFKHAVHTAMTDNLETVSPAAKMSDLLEVFERGRVAIVMEGDKFLGLITRSDLLSYLRRQMPS